MSNKNYEKKFSNKNYEEKFSNKNYEKKLNKFSNYYLINKLYPIKSFGYPNNFSKRNLQTIADQHPKQALLESAEILNMTKTLLKANQRSEFDYFSGKYPKCFELLQEHYKDLNKISLDKHKLDPFFSIENMERLYEWYLTKNPNFENINKLNPSMPEYGCLLSSIIKDLYIIKKTSNVEELRKITEILDLLEITIVEYEYNSVIDITKQYLILFESKLNRKESTKNMCKMYIDRNRDTPFIIFPSFHQISFCKIILNMRAPFINFLVSNKKHQVHRSFQTPCYDVIHNHIHYGKMMTSFLQNKTNYREFNKKFKKNEFKQYFIFMSKLINFLKKDFLYNKEILLLKDFNSIREHSDFGNYMNAIILFLIFHEYNFFETVKNINGAKYLENITDMNTLLKELFKNYFYKICINIIIKKKNEINTINNKNIANLSPTFIETIGNALYINIDIDNDIDNNIEENNTTKMNIARSNAILIINLYKEHVHKLHQEINKFIELQNENLYL